MTKNKYTLNKYSPTNRVVSGLDTFNRYVGLLNSPTMSSNEEFKIDIPKYESKENYIPTNIVDINKTLDYLRTIQPTFNDNTTLVSNTEPNLPVVNKPVSTKKPIKGNKNQADFTSNIYNTYYNLLRSGQSDEDAARQAKYLTMQTALESAYGQKPAGRHNYGGMRTSKGWMNFNSEEDFAKYHIGLLDRKWKNWRNAKTPQEYVKAINTGKQQYAPAYENPNYSGRFASTENRVTSYINGNNMNKRSLKSGGRPKAWIGAVIGAATSIIGSLMQKDAQDAANARIAQQKRQEEALKRASEYSEFLNHSQDAAKAYEEQFKPEFNVGGSIKQKLTNDIKITDGGYAIPIGRNKFLLRGGSHEDVNESGETGIGIKIGNKEIEAENGEVLMKKGGDVRIYSDSLTMANGNTPAEDVLQGGNEDVDFKIQQSMNGNYGINNKRRLRNGGCVSRRVKADDGIIIRNGRRYKRVNYPNSDKTYLQDLGEYTSNLTYLPNLPVERNTGLEYQRSGGRGYPVSYVGDYWINGEGNSPVQTITNVASTSNTPAPPSAPRSIRSARRLRRRGAAPSTPSIGSNISFTIPKMEEDNTPLISPLLRITPEDKDNFITEASPEITNVESPKVVRDPAVGNIRRNNSGMNLTAGDFLGAGVSILGNLASAYITDRGLNNALYNGRPVLQMPTKLVTNYNIRPRLDRISRTQQRMLNDIENNPLSSAAALNRRNYINTAMTDAANALYGEQVNKEVELLNQDALNQQSIRRDNINRLNEFYRRQAEQNSSIALARGQNWGNAISSIGGSIGNLIAQGQQRYEDDKAIRAYIASSERGSAARLGEMGLLDDDPETVAYLYNRALNSNTKAGKEEAELYQNILNRSRKGRRYLRNMGYA